MYANISTLLHFVSLCYIAHCPLLIDEKLLNLHVYNVLSFIFFKIDNKDLS